jgi:hypothetical protein
MQYNSFSKNGHRLTGRLVIFHMICADSNSAGHSSAPGRDKDVLSKRASNLIGKGLSCRERKCWIEAGLARKSLTRSPTFARGSINAGSSPKRGLTALACGAPWGPPIKLIKPGRIPGLSMMISNYPHRP